MGSRKTFFGTQPIPASAMIGRMGSGSAASSVPQPDARANPGSLPFDGAGVGTARHHAVGGCGPVSNLRPDDPVQRAETLVTAGLEQRLDGEIFVATQYDASKISMKPGMHNHVRHRGGAMVRHLMGGCWARRAGEGRRRGCVQNSSRRLLRNENPAGAARGQACLEAPQRISWGSKTFQLWDG